VLALSTLLYGCQHLEPPLSINEQTGYDAYRSQLRWLEATPQAPVVDVAVSVPSTTSPDGSLWTRMRQGFVLQKQAGNARVAQQRQLLMSRPAYLANTGRAGSRYLHFIVGELSKRNMPLELALLPAIESGFNPTARSPAQALGLWQFIPSTGKRFALEQRANYDERRDIPSSTRAAMNYLGYLHDYFDGDWLLALAAYNAGEGRVSSAIARNKARGLATDYWSLSLPQETQDYVPRLLALTQLVMAPGNYGVTLEPIADQPYFESIALSHAVNLAEVARVAGVHERELHLLNPAGMGHASGSLLLPLAASRRLAAEPNLIARAASSQVANEDVSAHVPPAGDTVEPAEAITAATALPGA
jgi:membrane-bound lytic murein transglycosylase D